MNKNGISGSLFALALFGVMLASAKSASAQEKDLIVRIAKLTVDSAQLENYKALLKEGVETAVRVEPGVLTAYAVFEKEHPTRVTVFEVYANAAAYQAHLQTPHFRNTKPARRIW